MRLIFLGTSGFATRFLHMLAGSEHDLVGVVCPAPRPAGRGRKLLPCPVETAARELGIEPLTPPDPNSPGFVEMVKALDPDLGVLVAYGRILRAPLLQTPGRGFINVHPSLLPRYRGAAPIQRALLAGETTTGLTVIAMNERVDAGDILHQAETQIDPDETAGELGSRLAETGTRALADVLAAIAANTATPRPQAGAASKAPKLGPDECLLDWARPARELHNRVRALAPEPGAYTTFRDRRLLVYRSMVIPATEAAQPGTLLTASRSLHIATGDGTLELIEVKPEGGRRQPGSAFRNGARPVPGERLG